LVIHGLRRCLYIDRRWPIVGGLAFDIDGAVVATVHRRPDHGPDHCSAEQWARAIPAMAAATMGRGLPADGQGTDQQGDSGEMTDHDTSSQGNPTLGALIVCVRSLSAGHRETVKVM